MARLAATGEHGRPAMDSRNYVQRDPASPSRPKVICAINDEERAAFLDGLIDRLELAADLVETSEANVLESIQRHRPEILVTAWSTRGLDSLLGGDDCSVRYVCHLTGSVRGVVPRSFIERGGRVTNWGSLAHQAVAEHALLLALATLRNMSAWGDFIAAPKVVSGARALRTQSLYGRRVGIHGIGGVAQALIRVLQPFAPSISSYSAGVAPDFYATVGAKPAESLAQLFAESDVLFECEALTPTTRHSVSAQELSLLPDQAVFINVARGDLVDEDALVREAASGRIRIALDVVADEPITPTSAVAAVKGAILSPHIAGPTFDQYAQIGELAVANIERYVAGDELLAQITPEIYDRST